LAHRCFTCKPGKPATASTLITHSFVPFDEDIPPVEPVDPEPAVIACPREPGPREPRQVPITGEDPENPQRPWKIIIKLADGKERTIQSMMATSFWSPDGTPISAAAFVERLFGQLPQFFRNEDELIALWSEPETRKKLLDGLAERGFSGDALREASAIVNAEKSDVFDVLAYIAFAKAPITRQERVAGRKPFIMLNYNEKLQAFLDFVLAQYVVRGVSELDPEKLPPLLDLKYGDFGDAVDHLGGTAAILDAFTGFQRYLYVTPLSKGTVAADDTNRHMS